MAKGEFYEKKSFVCVADFHALVDFLECEFHARFGGRRFFDSGRSIEILPRWWRGGCDSGRCHGD